MARTLRFNYILYGFIYDGPHIGQYALEMKGKQGHYSTDTGWYVYPPIEIEAGNLQEMYDAFFNRYGLILKKRTKDEWYGYTPEALKQTKKKHCATFKIVRH